MGQKKSLTMRHGDVTNIFECPFDWTMIFGPDGQRIETTNLSLQFKEEAHV